jgi:hypothetical protein
MTNSTTLEGWLRKTNFSKLNNDHIQATVRLETARMHATHYIILGNIEYSQWFPGKDNIIADSPSCDDDRSDNKLTTLFAPTALHRFQIILNFSPCPTKLPSG